MLVQQPQNEVGRYGRQNILRESPGPTSLPKRKIVEQSVLSAFNLLVDDFIIKHIIECTESEARSKLNNEDWSTSYAEICAVIGIMFAEEYWLNASPLMIFGLTLGVTHFFVKQCHAIASRNL